MSDAIKVDNLSKKYIIGHQKQEKYTALRDVLANGVKKVGRTLLHPFSITEKEDSKFEEFWALEDVSFRLKHGDRLGIIGRNGAGKSTLLKILSRITEPTTGRVSIGGRVASLLEVGTGFHPELTGRENIFLNGAILGMSKAEIRKKFDEIVDFSEVERFLDTPVKRYSSGMYVRLAFAVAAHLEPEILIVDEVLAVGDAQFQKKCLGKMEGVTKEGRTILFVSHNIGAIQQLCNKACFLEKGSVRYFGDTEIAIEKYLGQNLTNSIRWANEHEHSENEYLSLRTARLTNHGNVATGHFLNTDHIIITCCFDLMKQHPKLLVRLHLYKDQDIVFTSLFLPHDFHLNAGKYNISCAIPAHLLNHGNYTVSIDTSIHCMLGLAEYKDILGFSVYLDDSAYSIPLGAHCGIVFPQLAWSIDGLINE